MNLLRGDVARLRRCTTIVTGIEGALPRCKPFKYTYEKEIVLYAHYKKLDYFSTECIYSPDAYRGHLRTLIKDLERIRPASILDIIHSGESLSIREGVKLPIQGTCSRCNYISSQELCKACVMLEGLNKGMPRLGVGKSCKVKGALKILDTNQNLENEGRRQSRCSKKKRPENRSRQNPKDTWDDFSNPGGCNSSGGERVGCACANDEKGNPHPVYDEESDDQEGCHANRNHSNSAAEGDNPTVEVDIENLGVLTKMLLLKKS